MEVLRMTLAEKLV